MSHRGLTVGLALKFLCTAATVTATEWLSGRELAQHCRAFVEERQSPEALPCVAFVQGFLAGAEPPGSIDQAYAENDQETFVDRAMRTRLGNKQLTRVDAMTSTEYCVDAGIAAIQIVEKIAPRLENQLADSSISPDEMIRKALSHHFPCDG